MFRPIMISAAALALSLAGSASVQAQTLTAKAVYSDLDLSGAAGQRTLSHRVSIAVNHVCGDADTRDLVAMRERAACRQKAISGAQLQVLAAVAHANAALALRSGDQPVQTARLSPRH